MKKKKKKKNDPCLANKSVFTTEEAGFYLNISEETLQKYRLKGTPKNWCPSPPFVRLGRAVRYLKEDLDNWLRSHRITSKERQT